MPVPIEPPDLPPIRAARLLFDGLEDGSIAYAPAGDVMEAIAKATSDPRIFGAMSDAYAFGDELLTRYCDASLGQAFEDEFEISRAKNERRENDFFNAVAAASGLSSDDVADMIGEADAGRPARLREAEGAYFFS